MKKETLTALMGSIEKWKNVAKGDWANMGEANCPLCKLFAGGNACKGCPVSRHTRVGDCFDTPYYDFVKVADEYGFARTPEAKAAARKEVRFLQSLLPERPLLLERWR